MSDFHHQGPVFSDRLKKDQVFEKMMNFLIGFLVFIYSSDTLLDGHLGSISKGLEAKPQFYKRKEYSHLESRSQFQGGYTMDDRFQEFCTVTCSILTENSNLIFHFNALPTQYFCF